MGRFLKTALSFAVVLVLGVSVISAQENAGSSVAKSLRECYNTTEHLDRDSRPPTTIGILIDLIRKVENGRTPPDTRTLSLSIIHRFRQDGIIKAIEAEDVNVPYSPKGFQSNKNNILLTKLVVSDATKFPNETLNSLEKCSMHFMLSNTVETNVRGDEGNVCNKLGRYTQRQRRRRDAPTRDVEELDSRTTSTKRRSRNQRNPDDIAEDDGVATDVEVRPPARGVYNPIPVNERSKCPIESGVVWTKWGAIQAGSILAGIATGISNQLINVHDVQVDARYAATLSGDLVEAALYRRKKLKMGVSGNWNSTVAPRYYFIEEQDRYEITDAEIRGGLDGLIIAQQITEWRKQVSTLRISQILDMYYGPRGVLGTKYRACARKTILTEAAPTQIMQEQTLAFGYLFNDEVTFDVSPLEDEIMSYTQDAVNQMLTAATKLPDLDCSSIEENKRTATDLLIILDTSWKYEHISPALFHLLENLDVSIFGESRYKIINAMDGQTIMETSEYSVDFYQIYNRTTHDKQPAGFSARRSIDNAKDWLKANMNNASATSHMNGRSQVILYVPYMGNLGSDDSSYFDGEKDYFKNYLPEGKTLVLCNDNKDKYAPLVQSVGFDTFQLDATTESTRIFNAMKPVIGRFRDLPRSWVNPKCQSEFQKTDGDSSSDFYIEAQTVSYYRVSPHYFHGEGERWLIIQGSGFGTLNVCGSRTNEKPTGGEADCKEINSDEHRWNLDGFCNGFIVDCQPFYVSVESKTQPPSPKCTEAKCRFPDNIRFTVKMEKFECRGGSIQNTATMSLVFLAVALRTFF